MWLNKKGFTLAEIMVGLGIMGVLLLLATVPMQQLSKVESTNETFAFLDDYRNDILRALQNDDAWEITKNHPDNAVSFDCLINNTDCAAYVSTNNRVVVYSNSQASAINDSSDTTSGFTFGGKPCTGYDKDNGNNNCPIRIVTLWQPLCHPSQCVSPDIRFRILFMYSPEPSSGRAININMNKYTTKWVRPGSAIKVDGSDGSCELMGGTFYPSAVGTTCLIENPGEACPTPGEFVVGFDNDNKPICEPLNMVVNCPPDNYFMGVNDDGTPRCGKCP